MKFSITITVSLFLIVFASFVVAFDNLVDYIDFDEPVFWFIPDMEEGSFNVPDPEIDETRCIDLYYRNTHVGWFEVMVGDKGFVNIPGYDLGMYYWVHTEEFWYIVGIDENKMSYNGKKGKCWDGEVWKKCCVLDGLDCQDNGTCDCSVIFAE